MQKKRVARAYIFKVCIPACPPRDKRGTQYLGITHTCTHIHTYADGFHCLRSFLLSSLFLTYTQVRTQLPACANLHTQGAPPLAPPPPLLLLLPLVHVRIIHPPLQQHSPQLATCKPNPLPPSAKTQKVCGCMQPAASISHCLVSKPSSAIDLTLSSSSEQPYNPVPFCITALHCSAPHTTNYSRQATCSRAW